MESKRQAETKNTTIDDYNFQFLHTNYFIRDDVTFFFFRKHFNSMQNRMKCPHNKINRLIARKISKAISEIATISTGK